MKRIESIDFLRGLVIIIMIIDHSRAMFCNFKIGSLIGSELSGGVFFTRFITHYCAPIFVFLSGISVFLNGATKNLSIFEIQTSLVKRGVFMVILQISLVSVLFDIINRYTDNVLISIGVIWVIGISMIALALLLKFRPITIFLISIIMILFHNFLDCFNEIDSMIWNFLHVKKSFEIGIFKIAINYPLIPWVGVMGLGYCCGYYLYNENIPPLKRKRTMLIFGFVMIIALLILRGLAIYGDNAEFVLQDSLILSLRSFLNVNKYPPSLHYLLLTLTPAFFVLALMENTRNKFVDFISIYGKTSMFCYVSHLILIVMIHFIISAIVGFDFISNSISIAYIITGLIVLILYPLCIWFLEFRKNNRHKIAILNYL